METIALIIMLLIGNAGFEKGKTVELDMSGESENIVLTYQDDGWVKVDIREESQENIHFMSILLEEKDMTFKTQGQSHKLSKDDFIKKFQVKAVDEGKGYDFIIKGIRVSNGNKEEIQDPAQIRFKGKEITLVSKRTTITYTLQEEHNSELDAHYVPSGLLGPPVGTYLTIEGVAGQTKGGIRVLVETVNGHPLNSEIYVHVNSIYVTEKTRCKIKGYETGTMVGEPPAFAQSGAESDPKWRDTQLNGWQFWRYFVPMSIEYPEELSSQLPKGKYSQQSTGE